MLCAHTLNSTAELDAPALHPKAVVKGFDHNP
jgi:hypothetical protein